MSETEIPEWATEALPESLQSIPFLKGAENAEQFVQRLTSAAEHMGNSMRIPGPDASDDAWKEFDAKLAEKIPGLQRFNFDSDEDRAAIMKKLGQPESAEDYGAEGDGAWLADVALASGLTKHQFTKLVEGVTAANKTRAENLTAEQAQAIEQLHNDWGLSKPKKLEHIEGLLKLTGAPESQVTAFKEGNMDASTLKWLDSIAGQFAEVAKFNTDRNDPDALTPVEAQAQIQELISNPDYYAQNAVGEGLRKKMLELQKAANPGSSSNLNDFRADAGFMEMFGN